MIPKERHRIFIYIWVAYVTHLAHAMSKISKISILTYTGYLVTW